MKRHSLRLKALKYRLKKDIDMKFYWIATLFCLLFSLPGLAAPTTMEEAERAYQEKRFADAARTYEQLLAAPENANLAQQERGALYYNLGNCYYRTKELGKAVLNYQRALRLDPSDEDAAFNLQLVQSKLTDRFDAPSEMFFFTWGRAFIHSISATAWGYGALVLLIVTFAALMLRTISRRQWMVKLGRVATPLAGLACLLCLLFAYLENTYYEGVEQAVVMKETETYSNPTTTAHKGRTLHEGTIVTLLEQSAGGWQQVQLPDGTEVWLPTQGHTLTKC